MAPNRRQMRTAGNGTHFMARPCEFPRHVTADRPGAEYADLKVVLEAYQRPPTPLSLLTLRTRLLLPKVRAFVDFLQQHWMHPRPPL